MTALLPFTKTPLSDQFSLEGTVYHASSDELLIEYHLRGPLPQILFPEPSLVESRRDELWKHTCLEAFFSSSLDQESPYIEINCSPNGDWNAYSFSSYREGMTPTKDLHVRLVHREGSPEEVLFRLQVRGEAVKQARHLSLTAVIEFTDASKAYFALKHAGPQADFHRRDSFVISL